MIAIEYNFDYIVENLPLSEDSGKKIFIDTRNQIEVFTDRNNLIQGFNKYPSEDEMLDSLAFYNEVCIMRKENHKAVNDRIVAV